MTSPHLLWLLAGVGTILVLASVIGEILRSRLSPAGENPVFENLNARINAWWVMVAAIAGASMGGLAALAIATRFPHMYTAVGGFSDCANISSPENQFLTQWDISRGGGNSVNMWGKFTDPA